MSFDDDKLAANVTAFVEQIRAVKPSGVKGHYVKSITLSATMTPGIPVTDVTSRSRVVRSGHAVSCGYGLLTTDYDHEQSHQADGNGRPEGHLRGRPRPGRAERQGPDLPRAINAARSTCARRRSACRWSRTAWPARCSARLGMKVDAESPYWAGRRPVAWGAGSIAELSQDDRRASSRTKNARCTRTRSRSRAPSPTGRKCRSTQALKMPTRAGGDRPRRRPGPGPGQPARRPARRPGGAGRQPDQDDQRKDGRRRRTAAAAAAAAGSASEPAG